MKLRKGKIPVPLLVIVSFVAIFLMILELNSKSMVKAEYYEEKKKAAELALQSFLAIKEVTDTLGGGNFNTILTTTNPNLAALVVQYIKETGVKKNDIAAVSFTNSFPALNIAILSAIKILELKPIIITSLGATMWSVNHSQFTYLDMESILNQKGLLEFKTAAASIGGEDNMGMGLSSEVRKAIKTAIMRNNIHILGSKHLEDATRQRIEIYNRDGDVKLFITAYGYTTALADGYIGSRFLKPGELKEEKAILSYFTELGVPAINVVDVIYLVQKYKSPIASDLMTDIGEGELYYTLRYSVKRALLYLVILVIILFLLFKLDINYYVKKIRIS